jgi:hypothetical protein
LQLSTKKNEFCKSSLLKEVNVQRCSKIYRESLNQASFVAGQVCGRFHQLAPANGIGSATSQTSCLSGSAEWWFSYCHLDGIMNWFPIQEKATFTPNVLMDDQQIGR